MIENIVRWFDRADPKPTAAKLNTHKLAYIWKNARNSYRVFTVPTGCLKKHCWMCQQATASGWQAKILGVI